jgi:rare lipoprotein A (peptidoglycan hydrolase)
MGFFLALLLMASSAMGPVHHGISTFYDWDTWGTGWWHGRHGHGTGHFACGGKYTRLALGVAHKTLPCGTKVKLMYKGRSIIVPVVDRGPWSPGLDFDMTSETCLRIKHCFTGPLDWQIVK